jgi:hypothetical protein
MKKHNPFTIRVEEPSFYPAEQESVNESSFYKEIETQELDWADEIIIHSPINLITRNVLKEIDFLPRLIYRDRLSRSAIPNKNVLEAAKEWLTLLFQEIEAEGCEPIPPHVTPDQEGGVMFEWWHGQKKLSVFVQRFKVYFLTTEDKGGIIEITDGLVDTPESRIDIWKWLSSPPN